MCGICGFLSRHGRTPEQLKQMNDTMVHRGPDDSGEELFCWHGGWQLGLAQRRLAILDLSPLGHQPMHSRDGRLSVVFNGEIYNFQELKKELSDYPFRSNCDTEVILAAWRRWGVSCVERFRGMFAIAVADHLEQRLYLVRDRIGKKPLYYWQQGGELVFWRAADFGGKSAGMCFPAICISNISMRRKRSFPMSGSWSRAQS